MGTGVLQLLNHISEKKKKLTLADYNCCKDEGQFDMIDFVQDEFSIVKLYDQIEKYFMPSNDSHIEVGRFFCRHVTGKEMKVSE